MSRKVTILYIEDDPASRMLVDRTLRYAGYNVVVAERGLEGIDIARKLPVDLILTDINLPDITGRELTTMLRGDERFSHVPIVALTAAEYGDQRDLSMAAGITGYLTKPLDVERLPAQLEYYLEGGKDDIDSDRMNLAQTQYAQELVAHLERRIRELETKNKDLMRLDKIKDTFIQITAHELRTPLTLIYGYSRLLQDSPEIQAVLRANEGTSELVDGLVEAVERMQRIINEILTITRIMTNQIDIVVGAAPLIGLFRKVLEKYHQPLQQRNIQVMLNEAGFPKSIRADVELIEMLLDNLISNAIKYTPDGGKISIYASTDEHFVTMHITDTGIGIPLEDQEMIFERFHTPNDPQLHSTSKTAFGGGGLGLGLAICKGIVDAHSGTISVSSNGRNAQTFPGSEFVVKLPLVTQSKKKPFLLNK